MDVPSPMEWHPVLSRDVDQGKSNQTLSKEEQLRRERMRAAASGITSYSYHSGFVDSKLYNNFFDLHVRIQMNFVPPTQKAAIFASFSKQAVHH